MTAGILGYNNINVNAIREILAEHKINKQDYKLFINLNEYIIEYKEPKFYQLIKLYRFQKAFNTLIGKTPKSINTIFKPIK